jgi:hypothetical protein
MYVNKRTLFVLDYYMLVFSPYATSPTTCPCIRCQMFRIPKPELGAFLMGSRLSCHGGDGLQLILSALGGIPSALLVITGDVSLTNESKSVNDDR